VAGTTSPIECVPICQVSYQRFPRAWVHREAKERNTGSVRPSRGGLLPLPYFGAMRRSFILLLIGLAILGIGVAVAISILHDGLSARAKPNKIEIAVARTARHLAIPSDARVAQNPMLDSAEDLREARLHYADHCAICHANDGSGDTIMGNGLYPKPPDMRLPETQNLTDGELYWIIENGVRLTGMPSFPEEQKHGTNGSHTGGMENWRLVHFIRHLPHLSAAERLEMERYNPKGPEEREEEQEENDFLNRATPIGKPESPKRPGQ
jgi:mono/diheme cytochrome c family protein